MLTPQKFKISCFYGVNIKTADDMNNLLDCFLVLCNDAQRKEIENEWSLVDGKFYECESLDVGIRESVRWIAKILKLDFIPHNICCAQQNSLPREANICLPGESNSGCYIGKITHTYSPDEFLKFFTILALQASDSQLVKDALLSFAGAAWNVSKSDLTNTETGCIKYPSICEKEHVDNKLCKLGMLKPKMMMIQSEKKYIPKYMR